MKVTVLINQIANQYFFVSNLAQWHASCRKSYLKYWLKDKPPTGQERLLLKEFAAIHKEYGFNRGKFYLGKIFFLSSDPWRELSNKTPHRTRIGYIFNHFNTRFELVWAKSHPKLLKQQEIIENYFTQNQGIHQAISQELLHFYYLNKPKYERFSIYLLLSAPDIIGGGANLKPSAITLESSGWRGNSNKLLSVVYHEMVHLRYESYEHLGMSIRNQIDSKTREAIVSGLFPNGYLAKKYFQMEMKSQYADILGHYLENKKQLDSELIVKIKKQHS